ncbi:multiple sugar transport system permease protein [Microbacterium foliorum]|uniref:Multiple sugar transport system permease protein n=1 Tax=Microbacterium foliorum TaxID=104336 RepID=A0ABU1HVC6_9MICO|nr:sugar ABC transporter permease [Microbacterium foliorum]MDR6144021.1 multiple sugar transport system permease protein [Microbacterium foliorum]
MSNIHRSAATVARVETRKRLRARWAGLYFLAPFLVVFVGTVIAPVIYAVVLSVFRQRLIGGNSFVGLDNYVTAFSDPKFIEGLVRVSGFLVVQVPIMLALALFAAMAIDSRRLAKPGLYRISLFLPYAVPGIVAVLMWGFLYSDRVGLAGNLNTFLGFDLITPFASQWIMFTIGNIVTWQFLGYNMIIFYAALRTIPEELYEAAAIDGAGAWRVVMSVKLPALRGAIVIATIFSIIGSFQLFNEPNILRPNAPGLITTFFTPNMYAYNLSFIGQQANYAATLAIIMGVITAVIAYIVQVRGTRQESK